MPWQVCMQEGFLTEVELHIFVEHAQCYGPNVHSWCQAENERSSATCSSYK